MCSCLCTSLPSAQLFSDQSVVFANKCPLVAKLCNANTHNMVVSPVSSLIFTSH